MKAIHKFAVPTTEDGIIKVPKGAKFICAQMQDDRPHVWAIVETINPLVERVISVVGTGWAMDGFKADIYIGTVQDGPLVWHIFVNKEK